MSKLDYKSAGVDIDAGNEAGETSVAFRASTVCGAASPHSIDILVAYCYIR